LPVPERPPVTASISEEWLLDRYHRTGDRLARERLVRSMTPLVRKVARGYRAQGHEEDLLQVAWIALNNAIERYDRSFGVPLRTFAIPTMHGELRRYLRDHSWSVHVPRPLQERVLKVSRARDRLSTETGRSPTTAEIAASVELTDDQTLEALQAASGYAAHSLDAPTGDDPDEAGMTLGQRLGHEDDRLERVEELATLRGLRHLLDGAERHLLFLRFVEDRTQTDIAAITGTSQMSVSRSLRRTLDRLSLAGSEQAILRERLH
jgi:RNA polymerase sigma-B factor